MSQNTRINFNRLITSLLIGLLSVSADRYVRAADASTSPARPSQAIVAELTADQATLNTVLGKNNAALKSADSRKNCVDQLVPPLKRSISNLEALGSDHPEQKAAMSAGIAQLLAMLAVLDDKTAVDRINAFETAADPESATLFQACRWLEKWYTADDADSARQPLVDELEKLDAAHPDSEFLARLTVSISREATSPDQAKRMTRIVAEQMQGPFATRLKLDQAGRKEAEEQDAQRANKPMTLKGTLADGSPFSTEDFKGRVILVDFWAVWCVPCRAELPRVKKLYDAFHDKGLEVVGVSNDFDGETLKTFAAQQDLPWPQLFDAQAAAKHQMHPITMSEKIDGIPVMYLIDKKGVLRTVNARLNMEELIPRLLAEPG